MKKTVLILLATVSLISFSCKKESVNLYDDVELEKFKNLTGVQFSGKILNYEINWKFDNWDNNIGTTYGRKWGLMNGLLEDTTIQRITSDIYDYEKQGEIFNLEINSPALDIDSSFAYKKTLFETGKKYFHSDKDPIDKGFLVKIQSKHGDFYTNNGNQMSSTFEIVKVEETIPNLARNEPRLLVLWIVLSCNLYDYNGQKAGEIKDGKFITRIEL